MTRLYLPALFSRIAAAAGVAAFGALALVGPAAAHVEVTGAPAQAGAANAVLTFDAESESKTAGITALRVVLPAGIGPADVSWVSGPTGWTLKPAADGYTVSGPAVPAGKNARHAVKVRQLPNAKTLVFKTLQTYSDRRIDRWIGLPAQGGGESDNPAPVLALSLAAAVPSPPSATPSATASAEPAAGSASPRAAGGKGAGSDGSSSGPWIGLAGAAAAAAVIAVVVVWRRRGTGSAGNSRA